MGDIAARLDDAGESIERLTRSIEWLANTLNETANGSGPPITAHMLRRRADVASRSLDDVDNIAQVLTGLRRVYDVERPTMVALENANREIEVLSRQLSNVDQVLELGQAPGGHDVSQRGERRLQQLQYLKREYLRLREERDQDRHQIPPSPPTSNAPEPIPTTTETFAIQGLSTGMAAFETGDFVEAHAQFNGVLQHLRHLPPDRQSQLDSFLFRYQAAVSIAHVENTLDANRALHGFLRGPHCTDLVRPDHSRELCIAHVQHLHAQILVGLGQLDAASRLCQQAETTRRMRQEQDDDLSQHSMALLCRIYELAGQGVLAHSAFNAIPTLYRTSLVQSYRVIKQLSASEQAITVVNGSGTTTRPNQRLSLQFLPIWDIVGHAQPEPVRPNRPTSPVHEPLQPRIISDETRRQIVADLALRPKDHKSKLSDGMRNAIMSQSEDAVRRQLKKWHVPLRPGLHLSILMGNVEVTQLLITALIKCGESVHKPCKAFGKGAGTERYAVTPMHLAVATQQLDMISLLARHKASFSIPEHAEGNSAPPAWLIDPLWLQWTGNNRPAVVVNVLQRMHSCGWMVDEVLDNHGRNMRQLAIDTLQDRTELRDAIVEFVDRSRRDSVMG